MRSKTTVEKEFVITRFVNICWYFFKIAAALALFVAVGLAVFLFTRLDDEIRRQVQLKLAEQFPQLNISVGGARLIEGQGIAIYDLVISETSSTQLQNNLLVVDEIFFSCDAQLARLVKGLPEIRRVVVRRPQVWAAKKRDGRWNFASLLPLPEPGKQKPTVVIENAQFTLADESRRDLPALSLRDVNLTINPQAKLAASSSAQASQDAPLEITGSLGGPNIEHAQIRAQFDPITKTLRFLSKFEQLHITKGLIAWTAALAGKPMGETLLLGKVNGEVNIHHQLESDTQPSIDAKLYVQSARVEDPHLPEPVTDLSCMVLCQNHLLEVKQLQGNCGSGTIKMQLQRNGWTKTAPLALGLRAENISLDQKIYRVLPPSLKKSWDKFRPTGIADADLKLTFDGLQWRPEATLTGRDLAFESDKFRYRVNDGYGTIKFTPPKPQQPAILDINLVGHGGGQPLKFVGQIFDPQPNALGWLEITGDNLEIEKEMITALPEKARRVIQSMHPGGRFNLRWKIDRTQPEQFKPNTTLSLELIDCSVNYEKFPYRLNKIKGFIEAQNQNWTFRDLISLGSRHVECYGSLTPSVRGKELLLHFTGKQIPLDNDLRLALQPAVQKAWADLRPRGNIDFEADIAHVTGLTKPTIRVQINPYPESSTIQPTFFPYLMENLAGTCTYQDGRMDLSQLRANHGRTQLRTNGSGIFNPDGTWAVQLEGLAVDKLKARRDLTDALPPKLRKIIDYLRPSGSFSISNGFLKFTKPSIVSTTVDSEWDVELTCLQADIQAGIEINNIHGAVRLIGATQGNQSHTSGELTLDTATFQDVQFTQIRGPLWVDEGRCLFGEPATQAQSLRSQRKAPPRRLTAKVYDGDITADATVSFDVVPSYSAIAWLQGGNLQRMMRERAGSQENYRGQVEATLFLNGKGRSLATLSGHGKVQVTEADIYQLPLLVSMLKVLRNETPDSTAFNQVDSTFRIQGPNVYLDQIDFKGDAITLKGRGETNFDQALNLDFHTVIGRDEIRVPLLKNFVNRVGQHTLQMTVNGTLTNPTVDTQPLPGIKQIIKNIQARSDAALPATSPFSRNAELPLPVPQSSIRQ